MGGQYHTAAECTWLHRVALRAAHVRAAHARLSTVAGAAAARPASFADVPHSLLRPNDALDSLPGVAEFAVRTYHQVLPPSESRTRRQALARGRVPGHRPDGKPTYGELMLAVQPAARLASVLQVPRISSPMTLAVWARNNSYFHRPHRQTHPRTSAD
jgi:hypothetical protein